MASFLVITALLLSLLGLAGIVSNRNPLITVMSLILILSGANLAIITLDRILGIFDGQVLSLSLMALTILIALFTSGISRRFFRDKNMADVDEYQKPPG